MHHRLRSNARRPRRRAAADRSASPRAAATPSRHRRRPTAEAVEATDVRRRPPRPPTADFGEHGAKATTRPRRRRPTRRDRRQCARWHAAVPTNWVTYTSTQGDFTVSFPSTPKEQTQDAPLPDGSTLALDIVSSVVRSDVLRHRPRRVSGRLDRSMSTKPLQGAQDQAIANVNGTLIDGHDIDAAGSPRPGVLRPGHQRRRGRAR